MFKTNDFISLSAFLLVTSLFEDQVQLKFSTIPAGKVTFTVTSAIHLFSQWEADLPYIFL